MNKSVLKHTITFIILGIIYLTGFFILERIEPYTMFYMETWLDNYIPFNAYFVIFYVIWYIYMLIGFIYFIFQDDFNFKRCMFYLFAGMYIALIIYTIFPSGQNLRVDIPNDNILHIILNLIYGVDTSTNVCPSLHTYNSIMLYMSFYRSGYFKNRPVQNIMMMALVVLICASTVLVKQHAIVDVFGGIILSVIIYYIGKYKFGY